MYTFYLTAVPLLLIWLATLLFTRMYQRAEFTSWCASFPIAIVLFAPWVPIALEQKARWYANLPPGVDLTSMGNLMSQLAVAVARLGVLGFSYGSPLPARVGALLLLILAGVGTWHWNRQPADRSKLVLLWLPFLSLGGLVVAINATPFALQERYLLMLIPLTLLPLALLLSELGPVGRGVLVLLVMLSATGLPALLRPSVPDMREAGTYLADEVKPDTPVFVMTNYAIFPLQFYWPAGASQMVPVATFNPGEPASRAVIDEKLLTQPDEIWLVLTMETEWRNRKYDRGGSTLIQYLGLRYPMYEEIERPGLKIVHFSQLSTGAVPTQ